MLIISFLLSFNNPKTPNFLRKHFPKKIRTPKFSQENGSQNPPTPACPTLANNLHYTINCLAFSFLFSTYLFTLKAILSIYFRYSFSCTLVSYFSFSCIFGLIKVSFTFLSHVFMHCLVQDSANISCTYYCFVWFMKFPTEYGLRI